MTKAQKSFELAIKIKRDELEKAIRSIKELVRTTDSFRIAK